MKNIIITLIMSATLTACNSSGQPSDNSNTPETDVYLGGAWNLTIEENGYQCDKSGDGIINVISDGENVKLTSFDGNIKDRYHTSDGLTSCSTKSFVGEELGQWVGFDEELTKAEFLSGLLSYYHFDGDLDDILIGEFNNNKISVTLVRSQQVTETFIYTKNPEELAHVYLAGTWQIYATKDNYECDSYEIGELQVLTDTITIEDSVFQASSGGHATYGGGDTNDCRIFENRFGRPLQESNFDWLLNSKANLSRLDFLANIVAYYMNDTAVNDIYISEYTDSKIVQVVKYDSGYEYSITYRR